MNYKRKLIILVILIGLLVFCRYYFPGHLSEYSRYIFYPIQSARIKALSHLPVSFGDILYVLGGIWVLATVIRWVHYIFNIGQSGHQLLGSFITTINVLIAVYIWFLVGWGVNYEQPPLREFWHLADAQVNQPITDSVAWRKEKRAKDSVSLVSFDDFLVGKLNVFAPHYKPLSLHTINERAITYYRTYTDSKVRMHGLDVKPTLFGYFIERMGVDGYYNPFTGEGQVNKYLPAFDLPFVICHEMAHQTGIAAEGDANLMAYALGTMVHDTSFNYSCYLNIWLYANNRLYHRDSTLAKVFENRLNKLTRAHIDTLDMISKKYSGTMTQYSGDIYDSYLKMQSQKEGIRSYGNVVSLAWRLELRRSDSAQGIIRMP